jgi:hypothetical protein
MSQSVVKWGQLARYLTQHGYVITGKGGEQKVSAPPNSATIRSRNQVVIGHKCCNHPGDVVYDCYLNALHRAFGITRKDILSLS